MALIRAFSKVDKEGRISIPANIQKAAGLKEDQLIELKIVGASAKKSVLVTARKSAR
jgi:bifunctional DNA-binding transcriptional regulator/antitoxin component of YhaV-PrlF toxin-antitoxin module